MGYGGSEAETWDSERILARGGGPTWFHATGWREGEPPRNRNQTRAGLSDAGGCSRRARVHVQTMRAYIRSGRMPAFRLAGERAIRILRTDLEKVLEPLNEDKNEDKNGDK